MVALVVLVVVVVALVALVVVVMVVVLVLLAASAPRHSAQLTKRSGPQIELPPSTQLEPSSAL